MNQSTSQVKELAHNHSALLFVFDLLVDADGTLLVEQSLSDRRHQLEIFCEACLKESGRIQLSPATRDHAVAQRWFGLVGSSLEGVVAQRLDQPYDSGGRKTVIKVKKFQTMECVVGGFTYGADGKSVGSLLLGLFDENEELRYVGGTKVAGQIGRAIIKDLESIIAPPGFVRRRSGRFISTFPEEWSPVSPAVVVEVRYDRFTGGHFRHGTKFLRLRPDKAPQDCILNGEQ